MARNKRGNRKAELRTHGSGAFERTGQHRSSPTPRKRSTACGKTSLFNQFHDILPGTAIHEVYEADEKGIRRDGRNDLRFLRRTACTLLAPQGEGITVFNTTG